VNTHKTFRHGQILRLVSDRRIANQEELRRGLAAQKLRVTQATLSRDLQELRLIKTQEATSRYCSARRVRASSSARPRLAISSRHPARGKSSRLKNASQRRATLAAAVDVPSSRNRWNHRR